MSCLDGCARGGPHRGHFFSKLPLKFPPQTSHLVFEGPEMIIVRGVLTT